VVHRTHEHARTLLPLLAPAMLLRSDAIARLRLRPTVLLLEELLLLAVLSRTLLLTAALLLLRLRRSLHLRLRLRGLPLLHLPLLRLLTALLVRLVFATTPT